MRKFRASFYGYELMSYCSDIARQFMNIETCSNIVLLLAVQFICYHFKIQMIMKKIDLLGLLMLSAHNTFKENMSVSYFAGILTLTCISSNIIIKNIIILFCSKIEKERKSQMVFYVLR